MRPSISSGARFRRGRFGRRLRGPPPGTLEAATAALGATKSDAVEYSGTGRWFQFGQAPNPTLPWPAFEVSRFTAAVDYQRPRRASRWTGARSSSPDGSVRPRRSSVPSRWSAARSRGTWRPGRRRSRHGARAHTRSPPPSKSGRWRSGRRRMGSSRRRPPTTRRRRPSEEGSEVAFTIGRQVQVRRPHQRTERSRARADIDRQHRPRRHARGDRLLRVPRFRRA